MLNNGYSTNWFKPSKGVIQGCPLLPYLFILSTEILLIKICQNMTVKGIKLFEREMKLSQFVDDTNLFCADLSSVKNALCIVRDFEKNAGLELNIKITKAIWLETGGQTIRSIPSS